MVPTSTTSLAIVICYTKKHKAAAYSVKISSLLLNYDQRSGARLEWGTLYFWLKKWIITLVSYSKIVFCSLLYNSLKFVERLLNYPVVESCIGSDNSILLDQVGFLLILFDCVLDWLQMFRVRFCSGLD